MKTNITRLLSLIAAMGLISFLFTGCQTADGLGQDVENLGENIQN